MNNIKSIFLLSFFLFAVISVYSQENNTPVIEVTGNAQIMIEADMMEMYINVNVNMDDLQAAKNKNDEATRSVLEILKNLNIEDKDVITSGVQMTRNYVDSYNKTKKYTVNNNITVKTPNISSYEEITSGLIRVDNIYITNTTLTSTKAIETRAQARTYALLAAKKKAEDMAAIYGMKIGSPVSIQENSSSYYPNLFNNVTTENITESEMDRVQSIFKAGLVNINASVRVKFLLINK